MSGLDFDYRPVYRYSWRLGRWMFKCSARMVTCRVKFDNALNFKDGHPAFQS